MVKKYRGLIKMEVAEVLPGTDERGVLDTQIKYFFTERVRKRFRGTDRPNEVDLYKVQDWRGVQENECEDCSEVEIRVESEEPMKENLLHGIRRFYEFINKLPTSSAVPQYHKANLIIHNLGFFSNSLITNHSRVNLDAFYYGNLQGGTFLNHWETSFFPEKLAERTGDLLPHMRGAPTDILMFNIQATFEYDKNDIITIQFCNREMKPGGGGNRNKEMVNVFYKIQVRANSVRRAIWDLNGVSRRSNVITPVVRLFLDLNCPPFIENGFLNNQMLRDSTSHIRYTRQLKLRRGRRMDNTKNEWPLTKNVLSESHIFVLEFNPESVLMDAIFQIMSRFRYRLGLSMEFGTFSILDCICLKDILTNEIKNYLPPLSLIKPEINTPYHYWTLSRVSELPNAIRGFPDNDNYVRLTSPTNVENDPLFKTFIEEMFKMPPVEENETNEERMCRESSISLLRKNVFNFTYLIECLLSRGAVVKDQLLLNVNTWMCFLQMIYSTVRGDQISPVKNTELCESALEDLINMIDSRKRVGNILKCFHKIIARRERNQLTNGLPEDEMGKGFQRVRKVIITPTRIIYLAPETIMGNRVLRRYDADGTRILRITFRDDDNQKMRGSKTSNIIIEQTVGDALITGIHVAGRHFGYLGSSNSQMRDSGAYFMIKYTAGDQQRELARNEEARRHYELKLTMPDEFNPCIKRTREKLGKFEEIESIPKLMARLGQCFTQSRLSGVELKREKYLTTFDIVGGRNSRGEVFTFSDGCGMISLEFAQEISKAMDLGKGKPSCFQIRFRGIKGVVAVEPGIDEMAKWAESLGLESPNPKINIWSPHCMFRPSQDKFKSTKTVKEQLEMVKYSSPVPVALNKPFINILDQVSEHQSFTSHRRICERIEELLDMQMRHFARFILDESFCRNKLKEFPHRVDIDSLPMSSGFTLSAEPFFRSLIKASIKASVVKQLRKEQIPIPHEMGRSMLGVIDETGRLQYGQVFVRYTRSIHVKLPPETATRLVLTGPVMITKNPCIVPGDVRMFEAVDIPELHHHCDVLVFPQSGPRPHPDQMAGSDLDGDEYSVIWDKRLYFDHNEEPFDFACEKVQDDIAERNVERLMRNHYIEYLKLDAVGTIANNHLHQSDQYGLYSDIAMNLAKKNCDAVDFTKTDRAPAPLRYNWMTLTEEEEDGSTTNIDMPPERAERVPDYHFGNDVTPVYVSPRLAGSLFRELKAIDDVMKVNEEMEERIEVVMDAQIDWPGWEEFLETAQTQLARYNSQLRAIMENYGIKNESELFSGCVVEVRNRISDRDQDDMSYFNTNQVIETKMHNLYKAFRENFFEEFGRNGWKQFTTKIDKTYADEENVFHRLCKHPSEEMVRKAVACYKVCYSEAMRSTESKKLSFAWLAFEILAEVKKRKSMTVQTHHMTRNPIFDILDKHRAEYIEENRGEFTNFLHTRLTRTMSTSKQREQAFTIIRSYMNTYLGLDEVLFILLEWADRCLLFKKSSFREQHLCLLLILFITNHFLTRDAAKVNLESDIYIEVLRNPSALPQPARLPSGRAARITLSFFEFLASRRFRRLSSLSFVSLGFMSVFNRGQWLPVHQSALKTYYNILFNLRFEELPLPTDPEIVTSAIAREHETLVIELPETVNIPNMEDILRKTTGLEAIKIRKSEKVAVRADVWASDKKPKRQINKYILSSRGTLEAFYELKKIISVRIHVKTSSLTKELSTQLAQLTYEKIMNSKGREHLPSAFQ